MSDKFGVSTIYWQEIIQEISKNLGATVSPSLYIFGSRVKGTHRKHSDIDLLLSAHSLDQSSLGNIDFENTDIPYIIDLVLEPDLFDKYVEEINSHKVLITDFN
jgi:uncharacterized protein